MSLLTMGEAHRGTVANIATYEVSRFRTRVHEFVPMDPMIQPYVELAGFGHLSKIMSWSIDNKFILALCERWRPETHTFWFPTGECTVTLEDVYMLLGLRIEGKAVNGKTNYANSICMELLNTDLLDDNARGQGILLSRLKSYYNNFYLDEHSTEDARIIKTRCYIMLLLGSFLFPEGSGSSMHIMYLPLLRHIDRIGSYSWGSACLAYLYSSLCKNSHKDTSTFSGCAVLLQAWGWSRLPSLAPVNSNPFTFPYAKKWSARGMNYSRCPRHCITQYRNLLDHLRPGGEYATIEKPTPKGGMYEVNGIDRVNAKVDALTQKIKSLTITPAVTVAAIIPNCELCGTLGHTNVDCQLLVGVPTDQINYAQGNPYSNTYNPC
ncbi:protein MAIN-LIKE 2-like [Lathyrus oleraceus]|uniref:protein MAIN-LIKE 2-like n=1 Tax=Pisum sativum TaxID=3888 RepID=UPI0021CFBF8F|nr:protein MAIN-LIKE 2-like [Pisum sativum]